MIMDKFYVIDAHCHIYPDKIASKAAHAVGDFYGEQPSESGVVEDLINHGKSAGIDRFIVQSVATTAKQVRKINEFIAGEVAEMPDTLTGLGTLHPESTDIAGDIDHLQSLGLKGVKLHPDIQGFKIDDYRCLKIYELCEERHLPILMHTGDTRYDFSNPNRLLPVMQIYSGLTIVGAHFGGFSMWERASEILYTLPNLYVDCSSSLSYIPLETSREIIHRYGADRVLFGTDYPLHSPQKEIELVKALQLTDEEYRMILCENAKKVYNL